MFTYYELWIFKQTPVENLETWLLYCSIFRTKTDAIQDAPPTYTHTHRHHHLPWHCGRSYKYTWLEMLIAALTWYVKHWPHPGIVLQEALSAAAAAGPSVIWLHNQGSWDPVATSLSSYRKVINSRSGTKQTCRPPGLIEMVFQPLMFSAPADELISMISYRLDVIRA